MPWTFFDTSHSFFQIEGDGLGTQEALQNHLKGDKNYFFVELPEGTVMVHVLDSGESIPIQFGREVCLSNWALF